MPAPYLLDPFQAIAHIFPQGGGGGQFTVHVDCQYMNWAVGSGQDIFYGYGYNKFWVDLAPYDYFGHDVYWRVVGTSGADPSQYLGSPGGGGSSTSGVMGYPADGTYDRNNDRRAAFLKALDPIFNGGTDQYGSDDFGIPGRITPIPPGTFHIVISTDMVTYDSQGRATYTRVDIGQSPDIYHPGTVICHNNGGAGGYGPDDTPGVTWAPVMSASYMVANDNRFIDGSPVDRINGVHVNVAVRTLTVYGYRNFGGYPGTYGTDMSLYVGSGVATYKLYKTGQSHTSWPAGQPIDLSRWCNPGETLNIDVTYNGVTKTLRAHYFNTPVTETGWN